MTTHSPPPSYWSAIGLAILASFLLIWLSLGVGIIGADGDPANVLYGGVLGVGLIGAFLSRLRPYGMTRTLLAMAFVQALIAAYAIATGLGQPYSGPLELIGLNGFFATLWLGSAWLFHRAAGRTASRAS